MVVYGRSMWENYSEAEELFALQFSTFTNHNQRECSRPCKRAFSGCFIGKHLLYIAKEVVNKFITHSLNKQSMSIIWEAINKSIA